MGTLLKYEMIARGVSFPSRSPLPLRVRLKQRSKLLFGACISFAACAVATVHIAVATAAQSPEREPLPFSHKVELYRDKDGQVIAFSLKLEQPFLAEEFEKSNYLRLAPLDHNAYLIYPSETQFRQKHAEFYGRLRRQGIAKLRLEYETMTENLDGSRKVEVRQGDIEIPVPTEPTGLRSVFQEWAEQQNEHFRELLTMYPDETFFQYVLLQSEQRYGVRAPALPKPIRQQADLESDLYGVVTGSLAVQETLQAATLSGAHRNGDLNVLINQVVPPTIQSLPYRQLLDEKLAKQKRAPKRADIARLVPEDQYFLQFHSLQAAGELLDVTVDWGDSLLRLFRVTAQDNRVQQRLEEQLCLRRNPLTRLFADGVVSELAITGADPFVLEGTDMTLILRLKQPELFQKAADAWLAETKDRHPDLVQQDFNYRGHRVAARYTTDRVVSSFVAKHGEYVIYSNSHRAVRAVLDAATGVSPPLFDALDYQYVTTILPPPDDAKSGYLFASEAFIRRMNSPAAKISEKRRLECFNNLVMLNNASLMYRMESGKSPDSLSDLIEGHFVDPSKVVCPHGGVYAIDAAHDTCTCSLHNRLKYLTPNCELSVFKVSQEEQAEYERYKQRYEQFWRTVFDPIAVRITVEPQVKLETCVLPFANGGLYQTLRSQLANKPQAIDTRHIAASAVVSVAAVPGREVIAKFVRDLPGVAEVLQADPTLADMKWLGDQASLHFCDDDTVLEIDPMRFRPLDLPLLNHVSIDEQMFVSMVLAAATMPTYATFDIEDRDKAARLLEQLSKRVPLKEGDVLGLGTRFDAYRLPDYKQHAQYVFSFQLYAVKLRLHVAIVGHQIVAATKPQILKQAIDAEGHPPDEAGAEVATREPVQLLVRFNQRALSQLRSQLELHWAEKSRLACHHNAVSIYTLAKLYDTPIDDAARLSEAKYGVRYFCPEHGQYELDAAHDMVVCTVHGNRGDSRQNSGLDEKSSFARFLSSLDEVVATLRFDNEALIATVEIVRATPRSGK
jgi:hypothetical protein